MNRRILYIVIGLLTGCVGQPERPELRQYLDESSGATVTGLTTPFVFYKEEPMLAANARDYVDLGPVEINRAGQRDYLLWLQFWSTIDREPGREELVRTPIYLRLDGEPMALEPHPLADIDLGRMPYQRPVSAPAIVYCLVTRDQLRRIAKARELTLRLSDGEYHVWRSESENMQALVDYLNGLESNYLALIDE